MLDATFKYGVGGVACMLTRGILGMHAMLGRVLYSWPSCLKGVAVSAVKVEVLMRHISDARV